MCGASTDVQLVGVTDDKKYIQNEILLTKNNKVLKCVVYSKSPLSLYNSPVKVKFVFDWFYTF